MNPVLTIAKWVIYLCAVGWVATFLLMSRLPDKNEIRKDLFFEPVQNSGTEAQYNFSYKGQDIIVQPVAEYTLYGLIVSHNEPGAWYAFDISHDDKALNTRDICVLWGDNLQNSDYQKVSFYNDDNFCVYKLPAGARFNEDAVSNNHLITQSDAVRKQIATLSVGDQVYIKGRLVNYTEPSAGWHGGMRQTSTSRTDRGNGACEIIMVDELKVLDSYNLPWITAHNMFFWGFVILFSLWAVGFILIPVELIKESNTKR